MSMLINTGFVTENLPTLKEEEDVCDSCSFMFDSLQPIGLA
jgi:hypothetical protein